MIKSISSNESSRTKKGDKPKVVFFGNKIKLEVIDDFIDENKNLLIKKGTTVVGTITNSSKSKLGGKKGVLEFKVDEIKAVDGTLIPVNLNFYTKGKSSFGRTASTVGVSVLFPPSLLRSGKAAVIEAGTAFTVIVTKSIEIGHF